MYWDLERRRTERSPKPQQWREHTPELETGFSHHYATIHTQTHRNTYTDNAEQVNERSRWGDYFIIVTAKMRVIPSLWCKRQNKVAGYRCRWPAGTRRSHWVDGWGRTLPYKTHTHGSQTWLLCDSRRDLTWYSQRPVHNVSHHQQNHPILKTHRYQTHIDSDSCVCVFVCAYSQCTWVHCTVVYSLCRSHATSCAKSQSLKHTQTHSSGVNHYITQMGRAPQALGPPSSYKRLNCLMLAFDGNRPNNHNLLNQSKLLGAIIRLLHIAKIYRNNILYVESFSVNYAGENFRLQWQQNCIITRLEFHIVLKVNFMVCFRDKRGPPKW